MSRNFGPISGLEARFCYRKGGSKGTARLRVGGSFLEDRLVSALDRTHSALAWWVTVERRDWCSVCPGGVARIDSAQKMPALFFLEQAEDVVSELESLSMVQTDRQLDLRAIARQQTVRFSFWGCLILDAVLGGAPSVC